jgi:hypothetical protein
MMLHPASGGTQAQTFKLMLRAENSSSETFSVRLIKSHQARLPNITLRFAAAGLTPAVVGLSESLIIQEWLHGWTPLHVSLHPRAGQVNCTNATEARGLVVAIAQLTARMHALLSPEGGAIRAGKMDRRSLRTAYNDLLRPRRSPRGCSDALAAVLQTASDSLDGACGAITRIVHTHGDFHAANLLRCRRTGQLRVIDLEHASLPSRNAAGTDGARSVGAQPTATLGHSTTDASACSVFCSCTQSGAFCQTSEDSRSVALAVSPQQPVHIGPLPRRTCSSWAGHSARVGRLSSARVPYSSLTSSRACIICAAAGRRSI